MRETNDRVCASDRRDRCSVWLGIDWRSGIFPVLVLL